MARPILGRDGNEDVFHTDHAGGFVGMSFRFFDPDTGRWSIYGPTAAVSGPLDTPVVGAFEGDIGVSGGPTRLRPADSGAVPVAGVRTPTPRWEQAFSDDGGVTWETNWVMDFSRAEDDR